MVTDNGRTAGRTTEKHNAFATDTLEWKTVFATPFPVTRTARSKPDLQTQFSCVYDSKSKSIFELLRTAYEHLIRPTREWVVFIFAINLNVYFRYALWSRWLCVCVCVRCNLLVTIRNLFCNYRLHIHHRPTRWHVLYRGRNPDVTFSTFSGCLCPILTRCCQLLDVDLKP